MILFDFLAYGQTHVWAIVGPLWYPDWATALDYQTTVVSSNIIWFGLSYLLEPVEEYFWVISGANVFSSMYAYSLIQTAEDGAPAETTIGEASTTSNS